MVALVFGLMSSVVLTRVLGPEQRGIFAVVLLLPLTVQALVASGLTATIVYSVASGKWSPQEIVGRVVGIWFYVSLAMIVAGIVAIGFSDVLFKDAPKSLLIYSLALMPIGFLHECLIAVLMGKRDFKARMKVTFWAAPIGFMLVVIFVWWLGWGVFGAVTGTLAGFFVGIFLGVRAVYRVMGTGHIRWVPELRVSVLREDMDFGGKSYLSNVSHYLSYRADQFLVNGMIGSSAVGIYAVAVGLVEKLWLVVENFATVLFPAASDASEDASALASFTGRMASVVLLLFIIGGAMFGLIADWLVVFLYSSEFGRAGLVIVLLLPGIISHGHAKIIGNYLAGSGYPGVNAIGGIGTLAINIACNLYLIPRWGIAGAAAATSISYLVGAIYLYASFVRITGLPLAIGLIPRRSDMGSAIRKGWAIGKGLCVGATDRGRAG